MRRGYADAPNGQIHYAEAGTGPAIVLLHQVASSAAMFERSAPTLAARYRTVAIDAPGFGLSDPPRTPGDLHEFSDAVIAVLDSLEIESAHVVGFHTGASITLDLAVQDARPGRKRDPRRHPRGAERRGARALARDHRQAVEGRRPRRLRRSAGRVSLALHSGRWRVVPQ